MMDCGHFVPRIKMATRWNAMNLAPQCRTCNRHHCGRSAKFAEAIDAQYGPGTADSLVALGNQIVKFDTDEILEIANRAKELTP